MFAPTEYLRWVIRLYGTAPYDLAASGMKPATMAELGLPASLEDPSAWGTLRARIAEHNGVPLDEAVPTLGTTHALFAAYAALVSPGDEVLLESPSYEPMWRIPEGLGARVHRFVRPPAERFALDPERVAAAITARTRVVAITNLHNPGGVRASDEAMRAIAGIAAAHGAHLLVDEVYAAFDDLALPGGGGRAVWRGSARHLAPNVVVASSLTKGYGLGNHRIGWVLAPPAVASRAADAVVSTLGHAPLPHACLGVHAFDRLEALAARARDDLRGKREAVAAWLATRPDLAWSAPTAGLFGFVTPRVAAGAEPRDLVPVIERGALEHGVLVAPGAFFGAPEGFRLAWSIDRARLAAALERLERVFPAPGAAARG